MKLPSKERVVSATVVFALATVLIVLAVVQYKWSEDVSQATSARLTANLQASLLNYRQDLYRELGSVALLLQAGPDTDAKDYADRLQQWRRSSRYPTLVSNVYAWENK